MNADTANDSSAQECSPEGFKDDRQADQVVMAVEPTAAMSVEGDSINAPSSRPLAVSVS